MSEAIISGAIQNLESFLVETSNLDTDNEWIVKEAINELRMVLDFLRDKESGERSRLNYLLADCAEIAAYFKTEKIFFNYLVNELDELMEVRKRMMEFGTGKGLTRPHSAGERGDEGVVVGLEKDVQQLIGRVILKEERVPVVSLIKGMIGIGKTTLARQVYNHATIIEKFKLRAWLSISRYTSTKEVLVKLVQQLLEHDGDSLLVEEMDNQSLRLMLRQHLRGKQFFIVVDNLLPKKDFEFLFIALARGGMFVYISYLELIMPV